MNGAGVCVLGYTKYNWNVYICLNHSSWYKHEKREKCHEKPIPQKAFFLKI